MKKYRLKEEYKDIIQVPNPEAIDTLDYWGKYVYIKALEEVPQRIEISILDIYDTGESVRKATTEEKDLCDKALNGELLNKEQIIDLCDWAFDNDANIDEVGVEIDRIIKNT